MTNDTTPLHGLRVLDISRFIAGPYAGQLLAQLGADVVKIEEPGVGDPMRGLSKYAHDGMSAHFLANNASKRSLTLDLRKSTGRDVFLRLLDSADILIENFRPGVLPRLDLDHDTLLQRNPRLIVASITGFGRAGPWRDLAAYDLIAQAAGGVMHLTGQPGERAVKVGVPIGDVGASLYATIGILAALQRRERTGAGEIVDVSMMDVQLGLLNYHAHYHWISGEEPQAEGDGHPNIAPYQAFDTADKPLVVAVYGDPFWPGFCRALDLCALEADERFRLNAKRVANKAVLVETLSRQFATQPRQHWLDRFSAEGVPAAPLNTVGEALNSAQAQASGMVVEGSEAAANLLASPIKFTQASTTTTAPPHLGAHTREVLRSWAKLDDVTIDALNRDGVI